MYRFVPFRHSLAQDLLSATDWLSAVLLDFAALVVWAGFTIAALLVAFLCVMAVGTPAATCLPRVPPKGSDGTSRHKRAVLLVVESCVWGATITTAVAAVMYVGVVYVGTVSAVLDLEEAEKADLRKLELAVGEATTDAELHDLSSSGEASLVERIAIHPAVGPSTQLYLVTTQGATMREALASEAVVLWPEVASALARDKADDVRESYAGRADAAPSLLLPLLYDTSPDVAVAAFKNERTPPLEKCGIVQEILEGSDGYDHFVAIAGEMVDYCRSVKEALSETETP